MTVLAAITALVAALVFLELVIGGRAMPRLGTVAPVNMGPRVSIVFAALNEGPHVEAALRSMLAQRYPDLEVIAVDDRSTDDTGTILDRIAATEPRLRVLHITTLPEGWLGKNHALHNGAAIARGDLLVFTDADIVFDPDAVGRAVALMERERIDHLALGPQIDIPTAPLALVVHFFTIWFAVYYKPWLAARPNPRWHMGVGAFNAIRTSLYRRMAGHERIALRPDDDLKLGKLVKLAGGKQVVASGTGVIRVEWYSSLGEIARGFRKNAFAGLEYSIALAIGAVIAQLTLNVWPFVALFIAAGTAWWLNLATVVILMTLYAAVAAYSGDRPWLALFYPIAALIFVYILIAATLRTVVRGGIEWRGTFYPLSALRRNVV